MDLNLNDPNAAMADVGAGVTFAIAGLIIGWVGGAAILLHHFHYAEGAPGWSWWYINHYPRHMLLIPQVGPWGALPVTCSAILAFASGWLGYYLFHLPHERHIRGARWWTHRQAQRALLASLRRWEKHGVTIGTFKISQDLECRHTLLIGSSGGGKTTILWPLLRAAAQRGDRLLIFSFKGDFQERWQGQIDKDFTLLSPFDARSARWVLGEDIDRHMDAQSLAETLIPTPEKEQMWAQGAQALLVGVLKYLQRKKPGGWTMSDAARILAKAISEFKILKAIIQQENPVAWSFIEGGAESKTTASFKANLAGATVPIVDLGVADHALPKNAPRWSVRGWLDGKTPPTTIIGFSNGDKKTARAFASSAIEQCVRQVLDMPDCKPEGRRIWLVLDEVPQAGQVPSITAALEAARSKGVRVILGMQSLAQVRKVYDKDTATIWEGQCAIKMMCQIQSTEEQKWASTLVGEREIERYSRSMSMSATGGQATQHTSNYQRVREPLMLPSDFQDRLSADSSGAQAIFTSGAIRARIHVPRIDTSKQREMVVPASWLTRGYDRPIWGAKPPKVDLPDLPEIEDDARKPSAVMTPQPRPQRTPTVVPATPDQPAKKATENKDGGAGEEVADHIVEHVAMRALGIGAVATAILEAAGIVMENKGPTAAPLKVRRVPAQMADGSRPAANEEDERDREQ